MKYGHRELFGHPQFCKLNAFVVGVYLLSVSSCGGAAALRPSFVAFVDDDVVVFEAILL